MKLSSLLNPELIFMDLPGNSRQEIYENMTRRMADMLSLPLAPEKIAQDMMEREDQAQVVYEQGFAFPHTRYPMLKDLDIAIAILKEPVLLKENDKAPTRLVFCSMISENTSVIYLKALAAFSRFLLENKGVVEEIAQCRTPEAFLDFLNEKNIKIQSNLSAGDIMLQEVKSVRKEDPISKGVDLIARDKISEVPVVDENNRLIGHVSGEMLFQSAIPNYIMRMENVSFLPSFEPFEALLKQEQNALVEEIMEEVPENLCIKKDTPLIQLTIKLLKEHENTLFVLGDEGELLGTISYTDLITNVLRF